MGIASIGGKMLMTGFSKLLDRDVILARIVPCVQALSTDSSQHVRASLAQQISGLAPLLGKESTIDVLVPLYLSLLKDDFSEVRLNLISKLEVVNNGTLDFPIAFQADYSHWCRPIIPSNLTRRHGAL
jgi:serine/threonine-protein phosphatase 2A regulatory subunit A